MKSGVARSSELPHITENTTLVVSTDGDLFKFLKRTDPDGNVASSRRSGTR